MDAAATPAITFATSRYLCCCTSLTDTGSHLSTVRATESLCVRPFSRKARHSSIWSWPDALKSHVSSDIAEAKSVRIWVAAQQILKNFVFFLRHLCLFDFFCFHFCFSEGFFFFFFSDRVLFFPEYMFSVCSGSFAEDLITWSCPRAAVPFQQCAHTRNCGWSAASWQQQQHARSSTATPLSSVSRERFLSLSLSFFPPLF